MNLIDIAKENKFDYNNLILILDKYNIPHKYSRFSDKYEVADENIEILLEKYRQDFADEIRQKAIAEQNELSKNADKLREEAELKAYKKELAKILITSGYNFEGYKIVKYSGYISGDDATITDPFSLVRYDSSAQNDVMSMLTEIRRHAIQELKEAAYNLGCNAVIGVDFDYLNLGPYDAHIGGAIAGLDVQTVLLGVTANGTAVRIEKIED